MVPLKVFAKRCGVKPVVFLSATILLALFLLAAMPFPSFAEGKRGGDADIREGQYLQLESLLGLTLPRSIMETDDIFYFTDGGFSGRWVFAKLVYPEGQGQVSIGGLDGIQNSDDLAFHDIHGVWKRMTGYGRKDLEWWGIRPSKPLATGVLSLCFFDKGELYHRETNIALTQSGEGCVFYIVSQLEEVTIPSNEKKKKKEEGGR